LTRYIEERQKNDDEHEAIRAAFTGVGTALIMTTLVLLAGFVTVAFGDSREVRIFASMGGITIASALLGDLLFLPALLARYSRRPHSVANARQPLESLR
jgi:predicted RND superfamily exporter protein